MNPKQTHTVLHLNETPSTNTYVSEHLNHMRSPTTVLAYSQTAGRGQAENSWYASPGLSITGTTFLRHSNLPASEGFAVSVLAALAVHKAVKQSIKEHTNEEVSIKWPNDIYVGHRKIGGILIEHSLTDGAVDHSLIGIGINVNERIFPPELPNPTSISILRGGEDLDPMKILDFYLQTFDRLTPQLYDSDSRLRMHQDYLLKLYRRKGLHLYQDQDGLRVIFAAEITGVNPSGGIVLRRKGKDQAELYNLRQIAFVADDTMPELL